MGYVSFREGSSCIFGFFFEIFLRKIWNPSGSSIRFQVASSGASFRPRHPCKFLNTSSRWWQLKQFLNFHSDPWGFMVQFDLCIFFKWVG